MTAYRYQIRSSRALFGERPDAVYDVLAYLEPGLMLDVGAAAGGYTWRMLDRSPASRVIAFEPFPGNHPFLDERVGNDPRVTVVKAAVADSTRPSAFKVGKTVVGSEHGWEKMVGYSSLGFVVDPDRADPETTISVPTARIDDYVDSSGVRFMKIDVQGGELGVLKSAARSLRQRLIDIMFVEFSGEIELIRFILDNGFDVFDSEYLLIPNESPDLSAWHTFRSSTLSTGRSFFRGWPLHLPTTPAEYCTLFAEERRKVGTIQTDLVCVRSDLVDVYVRAARRAAETPV